MKKISLIVSSLAIALSVLSFMPLASAQTNAGVQGGLNSVGPAFPVGAPNESLPNVIRVIITWALYIAAVIAVLIIIYGGFLYITSAGDATQAKRGSATVYYAVIGLAIAVLAYVVVQVVYNTLKGL